MEYLVSVIIPVYNERCYLIQCIESILASSWLNIEIILVDDGSDTDVRELCDKICVRDNRCRCIHQKNQGLSSARVTGIYASKGKWITLVDDDDMISPYLIEELMEQAKDGVDIIAGRRIDTNEPEQMEWKKGNANYLIYNGETACNKIAFDPNQEKIITPMWGKLYRKSFLLEQKLERYKEQCPIVYFEDVLMTPILYYHANNVCVVNNILYAHREVSTSLSRSGKLSKFYFDQIESGNILCEFFKEKNLKVMFDYSLNIYLLSILRIYCLMDTNRTIGGGQKYKKNIKKYYKKYLWDYLRSDNRTITKIIIWSFSVRPSLWRRIVRKLYFRKP